MWKLEFSGRTLPVVSTDHPTTVSPPSALGRQRKPSRRPPSRRPPPTHTPPLPKAAPARPAPAPAPAPDDDSDHEPEVLIASILPLPPEDWKEQHVAQWLSQNLDSPKLPRIVRITEMHVRVHGSHKFRTVFANQQNEECTVWVSDALLVRCYRDQYLAAKARFQTAVQR